MVTQYIGMLPILYFCEQSTRQLEARVSWWWWVQAVIDLEGSKKRAAEVATVLESESDSEFNADPGGEEESSGAEWNGAEE